MAFLSTVFLICFSYIFQNSSAVDIDNILDLTFDQNDHLASHWLLYTSGESCPAAYIEKWHGVLSGNSWNVSEMSPAVAAKFSIESGTCGAVCLESGTKSDLIQYPVSTRINTDKGNKLEWIHNECLSAELGLVSYHSNNLNIYWLDHTDKRYLLNELKPGLRWEYWLKTTIGHRFLVEDVTDGSVVEEFTVLYTLYHVFGNIGSGIRPNYHPEKEIASTFNDEHYKSRNVQRTFTELGFTKGRLPLDLWGSIETYYYNNRNNLALEDWADKGLFVNWWEQDAHFIGMPWGRKGYWQSRLKELVQAWVGDAVPLETTDIYGLRRYNEGARLLTHVDRVETHAASLIVNVAQSDVRKPWKVEIYDHADRLHEIEMQPGEIVYYESARCLHGRMAPLDGGFYVNLFSHYRPLGDPQWYTKPNPPDAPEPLIDITNVDVPTLSPKNHIVHGGEDLFNYWEEIGREGSLEHKGSSRNEL